MPSNVKPRYVRVAQALALITGLAGASGCGESDMPGTGTDAAGVDAAGVDSGTDSAGTDTTTADTGTSDTTAGDTAVADTGTMDVSADTPPNDVAVDTSSDTAIETGTPDAAVDAVADVAIDVEDAGVKCFVECGCFGEPPGLPDCLSIPGGTMCCVAIGPLFPPNLPA